MPCSDGTHAFPLLPASHSAHAQLATSDRKPASPVEDGVGWGLDPLSANEGSLAAKKRKAQVRQHANIVAYPTISVLVELKKEHMAI